MRRQFLQRLFIGLLLVGRLILGEFAHGMPQDMTLHSEAAPSAIESQPCPDHATGEHGSMPAGDTGSTAHDGASHGLNCCDSGSCECACVHVSAIANPSLALQVVVIDEGRASALADGCLLDRPFALFRPPA